MKTAFLVFYILSVRALLWTEYLRPPQIHIHWDFSVVEKLPWNAGDAGSIPSQGTKILRAMEQLQLPSACT